ncbi:hypothetical protein [Pseudobacillus wudalianchiensis]|uniref:Spore coat protein n=1 Tax=Pseudobacillus wudalianchiensis TaxID=1743143 RepID=A0A1B9AMX9_9BACI|nr:hypothetical protein [Bacillus wudalianchiensis]OCA85145.1 hypothetical protein A8F95_10720 [Bacillus wudalianchiensis]
MRKSLGLHETVDTHELLTFKNLCVTKSALMSGLVKDQELKILLENDATIGQQHIQQLRAFLQGGGNYS